jgi:nickel-dependent lactate racemase
MPTRSVSLRYQDGYLQLQVPETAVVLRGPEIPALQDPETAVRHVLRNPVGSPPLADVARTKAPRNVVITMSDITRPVPNELLIGAILDELHSAGITDEQCTVLIATGMHRPSTEAERRTMLGDALLRRVRVVDHESDRPETLIRISDDPPVSANRLYVEADLKVVTGLIEPHFMAGYSGGRKGICPGLVDLQTVQRFHGHRTMDNPKASEGILGGNPCHEIAMQVAQQIGCDFLVNAAITHDRRPAGIFAGDMVAAHEAGCAKVAEWTSARVEEPFDLVITSGGGYPLDASFYQTVKCMVTALPALTAGSTLLVCSRCDEIGSPEYAELMRRHGNDWRSFLDAIRATESTAKDQWEFQMQTRVLDRIGQDRLVLCADGIPVEEQTTLAVLPAPGSGDARQRAQAFLDAFVLTHPRARIAVIPEGPYTMLRSRA